MVDFECQDMETEKKIRGQLQAAVLETVNGMGGTISHFSAVAAPPVITARNLDIPEFLRRKRE